MKTFQDLIRQGIAPNRYDAKYIGSTPDMDPFVRGYNNVWGIVSDTHMASYGEDQYIITGHMVQDKTKFTEFLYAYCWGGYSFDSSLAARNTGVRSLSGYFTKNRVIGNFAKVNGDDAYIVSPIPESKCTPCNGCCDCGQADSCVPCAENKIFANAEVKESIFGGSIEETIQKLNESKYVDGSDWTVARDVDGLRFMNENKKYILCHESE